jgi:predicted transcriptional regulator
MIESILSSLGFSQDESRTYLALLESGPITAGNLSKRTGIPRASLYGFLARLIDRGATTETLKNGVKLFVAEEPETITKLFRDKIDELQHYKAAYEQIIPDLQKNMRLDFIRPRFELFEGREGVQNVLKDMLLYNGMETQSFWPAQDMIDIVTPEFFRYHNTIRTQNKISVRALWLQSKLIDLKTYPFMAGGREFLREIRVAPENMDFTMGYWIYKNKVAFLSPQREGFGFIIESREFVEMQKAQFEILWALSKALPSENPQTTGFIRSMTKKT